MTEPGEHGRAEGTEMRNCAACGAPLDKGYWCDGDCATLYWNGVDLLRSAERYDPPTVMNEATDR